MVQLQKERPENTCSVIRNKNTSVTVHGCDNVLVHKESKDLKQPSWPRRIKENDGMTQQSVGISAFFFLIS